MKAIKLNLVIAFLFCKSLTIFSQTINWAAFTAEQHQMISVHTGLDYGLVFGAGYSYKLNWKMPIVLQVEYSFPSGDNLLDDFKTKLGGQVKLYDVSNVYFSVAGYSIFRQFTNDFARMDNFGCEVNGTVGYYRPEWNVAASVGFDKAIVTYFKNTDAYKDIYSYAVDGWYEPAAGGNFYYGLQAGYSFASTDLLLQAGKVITQDFSSAPLLPYYLKAGVNVRLN
jgi:hypothetical protein